MTVAQTDRTVNSVTINVSGITEGHRQTEIWINSAIRNADEGDLYTLQDARENGYISGFDVANLDDNNGDITVYIPDEYAWEFKVWQFIITNLDNDYVTPLNRITTAAVLGFEYENIKYKNKGDKIDITVDDLIQVWLFGNYIKTHTTTNTEELDYTIMDRLYVSYTGDPIYAGYLAIPADAICYAADSNINNFPMYSMCQSNASDIVKRCKSGVAFEAQFFEEIRVAINSFNLSVTI